MPNRRTFLKTASQLFIGASIAPETYPLPTFSSFKNENDYWDSIRAAFSLEKSRAFFNCATLGPSPKVVLDKVYQAMQRIDETAEMSHDMMAIRKRIAQFVQVDASEITLTKNTTEGVNIVANGLPLKKGDEIILTNHEHVGNALPWLNRFKMGHLKMKVLDLEGDDNELMQKLQKLTTSKTKVIAVPHITCTTGRVLPIKKIVEWAQSKGIFTFIDGAHGVGMLNLNLKDLGCDFYATCCHKWLLGPKGTGFLYVKKAVQEAVKPYFVGAGVDKGWEISTAKTDIQGFMPSAERFDYGTYNYAMWEGVMAAMDFMDSIGKDKVEARIKELSAYLLLKLKENCEKSVKILNPTEGVAQSGMLGFKVLNKDNKAFFSEYFKQTRVRFVPESGLDSLRISTHIFNSHAEIDALVANLKEFIEKK